MTDRYLVIGNPIAHSKSPQIHAQFAQQTGEAMVYERLLAPLDGFVDAVHNFIEHGGRGANVTLPFKLEAFALAEQRSERAQAAGAVRPAGVFGHHRRPAAVGPVPGGRGQAPRRQGNAGPDCFPRRDPGGRRRRAADRRREGAGP